ncbi:hypothetical protein B0T17DRAFT_603005 [Bombardia bombarda]|uniref:Uncharacterized protein n=1 Tax=Bombardia bombarda TaxID=252184 RepID=A0AA39WD19_9PEZI|nr:hypothetical protein B0T17DRAFT_603005 [Bombardia bombarda]
MPKYKNMSRDDMNEEGVRLLGLVKQIEIPLEDQELLKTECDKAFAKNDEHPLGTDIVYLFDVSDPRGFLGERVTGVTKETIAEGVVSKAIQYDDVGIVMWPIPEFPACKNNQRLEPFLNVTDCKQAVEYVRRFKHGYGFATIRKLFDSTVSEHVRKAIANPDKTKRKLFMISTGFYLDEYCCTRTLNETTDNAILALREAGLEPRKFLATSYLINTDDIHSMCGYLRLEALTNLRAAVSSVIFSFTIETLGGFDNPLAFAVALAGPKSPEVKKALKRIMSGPGPAKDLLDLMDAYLRADYHTELY